MTFDSHCKVIADSFLIPYRRLFYDIAVRSIVPYASGCDVARTVGTREVGNFSSPNYPEAYPNNVVCTTHISAAAALAGTGRQRVRLRFNVFRVEADTKCQYDSLAIFDGASSNDALIGRYCGFDLPAEIHSTGPDLLMIFVTDGTSPYDGYEAEYWSIDGKQ